MRLTTVLISTFVLMVSLHATMSDDVQCMCACCRGASCNPQWLDPMYDIPSCTNDQCKASCPAHFPEQCGQADSTVTGECMGSMSTTPPPSSASHIFNQYTTFIVGILTFTVSTIFRS